MWPRGQVRGALYLAMVGWPEFEAMRVEKRLTLVSTLEARCAREAADLIGYGTLVGKMIGLLGEKSREPETFSQIMSCKSLLVPDSELCPRVHRALVERMARKEACKTEKMYSRRHRCPECKDPMWFKNENLVARCADEPTKVQLMCDRCGTKQTF